MVSEAFEKKQYNKYKKVKKYYINNNVTIDQACEACGINKASYYNYSKKFASKPTKNKKQRSHS